MSLRKKEISQLERGDGILENAMAIKVALNLWLLGSCLKNSKNEVHRPQSTGLGDVS